MSSTNWLSLRTRAGLSSPANSTSSTASGWPITAVRITGANAGFCRDRSIMVRSTSSTAVSDPSLPPSRTMCWAVSIAL